MGNRKENERKSNRKIWCREICLKRKRYGEFRTLFKNLLEDKKQFFQYFRIITEKYNELNKKFTIKLRNAQHSTRK